MYLLRAGYLTLTPRGRGYDFSKTQDQRTVFTHLVSLIEVNKP